MKNIIFNTEMVKAILDGRKVQTRRVIKSDEVFIKNLMRNLYDGYSFEKFIDSEAKYQIGETIWVRESFVIEGMRFNEDGTITHHEEPIVHYRADEKELTWLDEWEDEVNVPWKPPMHMNKELARIFLKITDVRVERLQDISIDDIVKEGYGKLTPDDISIYNRDADDAEFWWINLWNKTSPKGYKWEDNPYVFVYEFEVVK